MKHVYFISGFGADERVFSKLNPGNFNYHFISWKIPDKRESIQEYAERLLPEIVHPRPVLIGLSFGGMMAIEISKLIETEKVIIISSIKTAAELPLYMKLAAGTKLNKILPLKPYSLLEPLENYNLGVKTEEEKRLVREYRKNINLQYSNWAIDRIINWKNTVLPPRLAHIHGSDDHIFPVRKVSPDYIIRGGGHFMIMDRAEEVNEILKRELNG